MKQIGYAALVEQLDLEATRPGVTSYLLERGQRRSQIANGQREEYYPPRDDPGRTWTDQLAFALRREGLNLEVLAALFGAVSEEELTTWIAAAPTSRYTRVAWFLFEWLTGRRLPLPDLDQGNYVTVLDESKYYTVQSHGREQRIRRQRVLNNLPGTRDYLTLSSIRNLPVLVTYLRAVISAKSVPQSGTESRIHNLRNRPLAVVAKSCVISCLLSS